MIRKRYYQQREKKRDGMSLKIGVLTLWYGDNIAYGIQIYNRYYIYTSILEADTKSRIKIECNYHTLHINIASIVAVYKVIAIILTIEGKKRYSHIHLRKPNKRNSIFTILNCISELRRLHLFSFIILLSIRYLATEYFPFLFNLKFT